jgi:hypothetical protein
MTRIHRIEEGDVALSFFKRKFAVERLFRAPLNRLLLFQEKALSYHSSIGAAGAF